MFKLIAILGFVDGLVAGSNQLHTVFVQDAVFRKSDGRVQRRLSAHGREQGIGVFLLNDLLYDVQGDRLDIGAIGQFRIGHDRGGVAVDQHDTIALLAEGLTGLRAGIIELAGLPDDDRPRTDQQNRMNVGTPGHAQLKLLAGGAGWGLPGGGV